MDVWFADRADAAHQLALRLQALRGHCPVVAAIPRGALPLAEVVAREVDGDLDVVLVHKLRHPRDPAVVVAAVDEVGHVTRGDGVRMSDAELAVLARPEVVRLRERRRAYAKIRPPVDLRGRVVLVIDEGLTTGATMAAAVHSVRVRGAGRVVIGVPVASGEAMARLAGLSAEVVVVTVPYPFHSVGASYRTFEGVPDEEVMAALAAALPPREG